MRHHSTSPGPARDAELIASFGACRLLKYHDGRFEFSGGSPEEREQAEEWAKMFLREAETGQKNARSGGSFLRE